MSKGEMNITARPTKPNWDEKKMLLGINFLSYFLLHYNIHSLTHFLPLFFYSIKQK